MVLLHKMSYPQTTRAGEWGAVVVFYVYDEVMLRFVVYCIHHIGGSPYGLTSILGLSYYAFYEGGKGTPCPQ